MFQPTPVGLVPMIRQQIPMVDGQGGGGYEQLPVDQENALYFIFFGQTRSV